MVRHLRRTSLTVALLIGTHIHRMAGVVAAVMVLATVFLHFIVGPEIAYLGAIWQATALPVRVCWRSKALISSCSPSRYSSAPGLRSIF